MLELHQAVPARGAVLVSINTRLSRDEMAYILQHSGAVLLVGTVEFEERARDLAAQAGIALLLEGDDYEERLAANAGRQALAEVDERDLMAINYTSGTTGRPRGVMYHHRGAYLQAVAMAYHTRLAPDARYLWVLPMFHCNGWCFTWAVTAAGAAHVCLRTVDPDEVWRLLRDEGVTHFSGAPTVLIMLAQGAPPEPLKRRVHVDIGGAPPSPALLARLGPLGLDITHLYGLTETYGPVAINEWQAQWTGLDGDERSRLQSRQGIGNIVASPLRVLDDNGVDVPADGETIGELAVRGNDVMLGYYCDEEATAAVARSGCFLTGDLAVMHQDGYVEIRDRRKDIIISGGENVASVEVEQVLAAHPSIVECAVVGVPDDRWGEVPVAFVAGDNIDVDELAAFARERLAHFKVPKHITVTDLPKTSTGKIRKNVLRERGAGSIPQ